MNTVDIENKVNKDKNILVVLLDKTTIDAEINYLIQNFCGKVQFEMNEINFSEDNRIYICGNLSKIKIATKQVNIIKELSTNYDDFNQDARIVTLGQVPILIHNAGVYYRHLFDEPDLFDRVKSEHTFQELTESTKDSKSFRKGIYLTEILKEHKDQNEMLHFRLLRCSSNLSGSTDNFRKTDHHIINLLNESVRYDFESPTKLNHVLAQIYENKKNENQKEVKAKIKAHSDKTKDMPKNGLIAFCTFYDMSSAHQLNPSKSDRYDWCYKETSALTKLHFKLKKTVEDDTYIKEFTITLYPNSIFIIPLSTNRLYTHEIRPSILNIDKIPTRMGYVVRCSNLEAVYMNNQTFIKEDGKLIKLTYMTAEMLTNLRNVYYEENTSGEIINYEKIHFSMNIGDYEKPMY